MGKDGNLLPTNSSGKMRQHFCGYTSATPLFGASSSTVAIGVLFLDPSFTLKVEELAGGQRGNDEGDALIKQVCVEIRHDH